MKNFIQTGEIFPHTVTSGEATINPGDVVVEGNLIGIAQTGGTYALSSIVTVKRSGVYKLAKAAPLVITKGDKIYWDATAKKVTKTASDRLLGVAWEGATENATTVEVLLEPGDEASQVAAEVNYTAGANLTAVPGSFADEAAVKSYLDTHVPEVEDRLDAIDTALGDILTNLKAAGLMAD